MPIESLVKEPYAFLRAKDMDLGGRGRRAHLFVIQGNRELGVIQYDTNVAFFLSVLNEYVVSNTMRDAFEPISR